MPLKILSDVNTQAVYGTLNTVRSLNIGCLLDTDCCSISTHRLSTVLLMLSDVYRQAANGTQIVAKSSTVLQQQIFLIRKVSR